MGLLQSLLSDRCSWSRHTAATCSTIILKIYAYVIAAPRKLLAPKLPVHLSTCNRSPMGKQCANSWQTLPATWQLRPCSSPSPSSSPLLLTPPSRHMRWWVNTLTHAHTRVRAHTHTHARTTLYRRAGSDASFRLPNLFNQIPAWPSFCGTFPSLLLLHHTAKHSAYSRGQKMTHCPLRTVALTTLT